MSNGTLAMQAALNGGRGERKLGIVGLMFNMEKGESERRVRCAMHESISCGEHAWEPAVR